MKNNIKGGNSGISTIMIILIFIFFIFCIIFIVFIVFISIQKSPNIDPNNLNALANLPFQECFDLSTDAKNVFRILKAINMDVKYIQLLNAYSLILCQLKDFKTSCEKDTINQINKRLSTLDSWGADSNNANAISIVKSITHITDPSSKRSQFLFKICMICEKNIKLIQQDNTFNTPTKNELVGFNSQFYRIIFDQINKLCVNIKQA
jgi:hypothetical protein